MSALDQDVIRHALTVAQRHGFKSVKLKVGSDRFAAILGESHDADSAADLEMEPNQPLAVVELSGDIEVTAPVVGYFRNGKMPLQPGRKVESGEALCEIVALGIANDVVARTSGEVQEVHVAEGEPVEYGQLLATVKAL